MIWDHYFLELDICFKIEDCLLPENMNEFHFSCGLIHLWFIIRILLPLMFLFGITGNLIGPIQLNWSSLRSKIQHFKFSRPRDLDHQRPLWSCGIICWCAGDIVFRVLSPKSSVRKKLAKLVVDLWTTKFQETPD